MGVNTRDPGCARGATGGEVRTKSNADARQDSRPARGGQAAFTASQLERIERAEKLCEAVAASHPRDATQIMTAMLDSLSAGVPGLHPFGDLRADAQFWVDTAHPLEIEAYFAASLKRLGGLALGIRARKRLLVELWHSLPVGDRAAFLARIGPDGDFRGKSS